MTAHVGGRMSSVNSQSWSYNYEGIIRTVLKSKFYELGLKWYEEQAVKNSELKHGLRLMSAIHKHKGTKKFRTRADNMSTGGQPIKRFMSRDEMAYMTKDEINAMLRQTGR